VHRLTGWAISTGAERWLIGKASDEPAPNVSTQAGNSPRDWTRAHARWLATQAFQHPAQQIVFQDAVDAIEDCASRLHRLEEQLYAIVPNWSMAPVVDAYQAMRGVSFIVAVTFVAEIGDVRRFENPNQLMAFLGLVPSERSTGDNVRRAGLTLAGNQRARRALVEGAWTYRYQARVSARLQKRLEEIPKPVRDIAWKGPGSPVWSVSPACSDWQEEACHRRGYCSRDGCFSVGYRPARHSCLLTKGDPKMNSANSLRPACEYRMRSRAPPS
jgi:Transposase IS116/IS110/IS902 family